MVRKLALRSLLLLRRAAGHVDVALSGAISLLEDLGPRGWIGGPYGGQGAEADQFVGRAASLSPAARAMVEDGALPTYSSIPEALGASRDELPPPPLAGSLRARAASRGA